MIRILLIACAVLTLCGCNTGTRHRQRCEKNALIRGAAELQCKDVKLRSLGSNVLVTGCGRSVVYECCGSTPEKEGSRAERISG